MSLDFSVQIVLTLFFLFFFIWLRIYCYRLYLFQLWVSNSFFPSETTFTVIIILRIVPRCISSFFFFTIINFLLPQNQNRLTCLVVWCHFNAIKILLRVTFRCVKIYTNANLFWLNFYGVMNFSRPHGVYIYISAKHVYWCME